MTHPPRVVVALALAVATSAPAAAQNARERQMMADIRMLQEQTEQQQLMLQSAISSLTDALKAINGRLDDQANATRKAFADQKLVVDQFASDLRVVRERVDETNVRITSLSQELEALRLSIPQYPSPAPISGDPSTMPGTPGGTMPVAPPPTPIGPGMSPQRLYDTAWADFTAGQWALCITGFETYLRTFPRSELSDNAQNYIGECNFADGKFTEAIDAYNQVIANYPKGDAAPSAYYKRGLAFDRLGQADRARESFEQVMKQFPDTDEARLAKQNLDRLNRGRPKG